MSLPIALAVVMTSATCLNRDPQKIHPSNSFMSSLFRIPCLRHILSLSLFSSPRLLSPSLPDLYYTEEPSSDRHPRELLRLFLFCITYLNTFVSSVVLVISCSISLPGGIEATCFLHLLSIRSIYVHRQIDCRRCVRLILSLVLSYLVHYKQQGT